jgi:hypothetical protein
MICSRVIARDEPPPSTTPLLWDGDVPSNAYLRRKSHPMLHDEQLNSRIVNALRLSHELVDLIREEYPHDSSYGDEGEWTKDSRIKARIWHFWRLDRMCVPRNSKLRLRLIFEVHYNQSVGHMVIAGTFARVLGRF